jgi:kinesin family protein 2/24
MTKKHPDGTDIHSVLDSEPVKENRISVCIRMRPLNGTEVARNEVDVISVLSKDEIVVHETKTNLDLSNQLKTKTSDLTMYFTRLLSKIV